MSKCWQFAMFKYTAQEAVDGLSTWTDEEPGRKTCRWSLYRWSRQVNSGRTTNASGQDYHRLASGSKQSAKCTRFPAFTLRLHFVSLLFLLNLYLISDFLSRSVSHPVAARQEQPVRRSLRNRLAESIGWRHRLRVLVQGTDGEHWRRVLVENIGDECTLGWCSGGKSPQ